VYCDIREKVGDDYPVLIKVGVEDGFPGGLGFSEGKQAAQLLAQWGYDAIEISQGLRGKWYEGTEFRTRINHIDREAYFRNWCKEVKTQTNVSIMMVGGLRTFGLMEEIIQRDEADFISLCRPLIKDPHIINEWKGGDHRRVTCISCNKCYKALLEGETLHCVQREIE
jgi:2,4-dienoyl-CoA reductase-like NADH-dependent reductase (Old Yellow Enzyme family)